MPFCVAVSAPFRPSLPWAVGCRPLLLLCSSFFSPPAALAALLAAARRGTSLQLPMPPPPPPAPKISHFAMLSLPLPGRVARHVLSGPWRSSACFSMASWVYNLSAVVLLAACCARCCVCIYSPPRSAIASTCVLSPHSLSDGVPVVFHSLVAAPFGFALVLLSHSSSSIGRLHYIHYIHSSSSIGRL
jgi:hypothetical protein